MHRVSFTLFVFALIVSYYSSTSKNGEGNCATTSDGPLTCPNPATTKNPLLSIGRVYYCDKDDEKASKQDVNKQTEDKKENTVHIAVVACGVRLDETLVMIKSALTFGHSPLHFHIFADDELRPKFNETLLKWKKIVDWKPFQYSLYKITFPSGNFEDWKKLFKPCACQRLFIPDLLTTVDSLLYVDTDILFLRPPEAIWEHFSKFNSSHITALTPENEANQRSINWYVRFARHPFYQPLGVNSGVMLMNLTRMREFNWGSHLQPTFNKYRYNTTWGDQDIINIIFHYHPERVYTYGCEWNYRADHCMYMSACRKAEEEGASMLHGSRGYFHDPKKQPAFKAVYDAFKEYKLGASIRENLLLPMVKNLENADGSSLCITVPHIFTKQLYKYVDSLEKQKSGSS